MKVMRRLKKGRQRRSIGKAIKKSLYVRKEKKGHRVVIKMEENGEAWNKNKQSKEAINGKSPGQIMPKSNNNGNHNGNDEVNNDLSPQYSSNLESDSNSDYNEQPRRSNGFYMDRSLVPSYQNFLQFMEAALPLSNNNRHREESNSFLLIKALVEVHHQIPKRSPFEKSREIVRNLPKMPSQPPLLPVLNQSLDLDYNLLHLEVKVDFSVRKLDKNFKRTVSYSEEKSLGSLSLHFKMPRENLEALFNSVSRYFPDLLEVFKGNNRVVWNKEEDEALREGIFVGKDRGRIMRRRRFFGIF